MRKQISGAVMLTALACAAQAESTQTEQPEIYRTLCEESKTCLFTHWTISAGLGQASSSYDANNVAEEAARLGFEVYDIDVDTDRLAYKLNVGVSLSQDWTVEAGYTDLGEVSTAFSTTTANPQGFFDLTQAVHPESVHGVTLSAVYQIWGNEQGYFQARIGGYFWQAEFDSLNVFDLEDIERLDDEAGADIYFGVGYHFAFNEHWQVGIDWERYTYIDTHSSVFMLNLAYRFANKNARS